MSYCKARLDRVRKTGTAGTVILLVLGGLFAAFGLFMAIAIAVTKPDDRHAAVVVTVVMVVIFLLPGLLMLTLGIRRLQAKHRDSDPERSRLAGSIRRQLPAEQAGLPLDQIFAIVDQDLAGGQEYGKDVVIGREWALVGDLAVPIRRIRGVFLQMSAHRTQYTYLSSHIITVCDDARACGTAGFLAGGERATACYKALCTAAPWAMRGGLKEQGELMALSPEQLSQWNADLERRQAEMDQPAR